MSGSGSQQWREATSDTTKHSDLDKIEPVEEQVEYFRVRAKGIGRPDDSPTSTIRGKHGYDVEEYYDDDTGEIVHGVAELVPSSTRASTRASGQPDADTTQQQEPPRQRTFVEKFRGTTRSYFAYIKTRDFWTVLLLGQVLSLCLTGTNTFTSLLQRWEMANFPAFQTFFNYCLLNLIYTSYTIYRYGFKKWARVVVFDGWRYFVFAFCDVQGNYFTVLGYIYTTILSAQLINFWAIVMVVLVSLIFLGVRYKLTQYAGILVCVGGMGILLASDHITGANGGDAANELKGDLFALVGATFYGLSNVFEEYLVSKRPMYEVLGQLAFWGLLINGVQCAIFDRDSIRDLVWTGKIGGYLAGYTVLLTLFYSLAPLMFRLGSAAFFNISLLTSNFWGAIIGIHLFNVPVHFLYPLAFVLIVVGLFVYFLTESIMGQATKPWLGENQEKGVSGVGTARRRVELAADPSSV